MRKSPATNRCPAAVLLLLLLVLGGAPSAWSSLFGDDEQQPPQYGDYPTKKLDYFLPHILDWSGPWAVVVLPSQVLEPDNTERFPLLVFAHGRLGGGFLTYWLHKALFHGVASFGFIVVAPASCSVGCWNDGFGFDTYHQELLKLIDWASSEARDEDIFDILKSVDRNNGYGLFGHSRGGWAVVRASSQFEEYNIRATVLLHPSTLLPGTYESTVPLAAFTGSRDRFLNDCCGEVATKFYYEQASSPKAYASMVGADHLEPLLFSTRWSAYTAAWFKIWIENDESVFYDLFYGDDDTSLCGGRILMKDDCEALME